MRSLVVVVIVVVGVGGLPVLLLMIQGSTTAGRTGFTFQLLPLQSHYLFSLLLWWETHLLMMLMFVGAGRLSLGIPARVRHDACLKWAMLPSHSLLLLVGLVLGHCLWGMSPPSGTRCPDQSWRNPCSP